jgi:hypothetical protein
MFGTPYNSPSWPADADRDFYRAQMRRGYPNASDAQIENLAAAGAKIDVGSKHFVSTARAGMVDGEPVDPATAAEFRLLGQPERKTLGLRYDRRAA